MASPSEFIHTKLDYFVKELVNKIQKQEESFKQLCDVDSSKNAELGQEALEKCVGAADNPLNLAFVSIPVVKYFTYRKKKSKALRYSNTQWQNDDLVAVVVEAGVALFRSFEHQFSLVNDHSGNWKIAFDKLAVNARDRFVTYCIQNPNVTITPAVFTKAVITEATGLFSSLRGNNLIFNGKPCKAGDIFEKTNGVLFDAHAKMSFKFCKFQSRKQNHVFGYRLLMDFEKTMVLSAYEMPVKEFKIEQKYLLDSSNANLHTTRIAKQMKRQEIGYALDEIRETFTAQSKKKDFQSPMGDVEKYYIERVFTRNVYVDKALINESNLFVVVDNNQGMTNKLSTGKEILLLSQDNPLITFLRIENNMHWLTVEEEDAEHYTWIQSKQSLQNLRRFIDCNRLQELNEIDDDLVILAAEPGMGKTTLFMHMQNKFEKMEVYSIHIALKDFTSYLKDPDTMNVLNFLYEASEVYDPLERERFQKRLMIPNYTMLFFDGFDEVDLFCRKKIINYLKMLRSCFKIKQIWISTRPYFREELENAFGLIAYQLKEFSVEEQQKFLVGYWSRNSVVSESIAEKAKKLVELLYTSINEKSRSFMGIPLQSRMVAEAFEDSQDLPVSIDLLTLYNCFISKKYEIYVKEKMRIDKQAVYTEYVIQAMQEKLEECYKTIAVKLLFKYDDIVNNLENNNDNYDEKIALTGLISDFKNGVPVFLHRTFAEYFASKWLVENCQTPAIITFLQTNIFKEEFRVIFQFFDAMVITRSAGKADVEIHKLVLNNDLPKIKALLAFDRLVEHRDYCGRTALHIAMSHGNADIVNFLLKKGADPNITDGSFGWTPLIYGCRAEKWNCVDVILNYTNFDNVNIADLEDVIKPQNMSLMDLVIVRNLLEVYKLMHKKYCEKDSYQYIQFDAHMVSAIHCGSYGIVQYLLESELVETNLEYLVRMLNHAIRSNQIDIVQYILREVTNVFYETKHEQPPIVEAVYQCNPEILKLVLDNTINSIIPLNQFTWKGQTLIEYALTMQRSHKVDVAVIELLLKYGPLEHKNNHYDMENNILLLATSTGNWNVAKYLIEQCKFNVNTHDDWWKTPLYYAIYQNNLDIVKYLISRNATVSYATSVIKFEEIICGWDMLSCLIMKKQNYECESDIKFLFLELSELKLYRLKISTLPYKNADTFVQRDGATASKQTPRSSFRTFIRKPSEEQFYFECDTFNFKCNDTIMYLEVVENLNHVDYENFYTDDERYDVLLVSKNVDWETLNSLYRNTTLMLKANYVEVKGKFYLQKNTVLMCVNLGSGIRTKELNSVASIKCLVDNLNKDPNELDCFERTLFYRIATDSNYENYKGLTYLLENGADINRKDVIGNTILHRAAMQKDERLVEFLLSKDAKIDKKNYFGTSVLHYSARACLHDGNSVLKKLIKSEPNLISATDIFGINPLQVSIFYDRTCTCPSLRQSRRFNHIIHKHLINKDTINAKNSQSNNAIFLAVMKKKPSDIIELLIKKGATVYQENHSHTLLHEVVIQGDTETLEIIISEMKRIPAKYEEYINRKNASGKTPLMTAVLAGKYAHVEMLIQAGANVAFENSKHESALYFAVQCSRPDIVELLVDSSALEENLKGRLVNMVEDLQKRSTSSRNLNKVMDILKSNEISEVDNHNQEQILTKVKYFAQTFVDEFQKQMATNLIIPDGLLKESDDFFTLTFDAIKEIKWDSESMTHVLVNTALKLFKCFEHQFSTITNIEGDWREGLRYLAIDASRRAISYVKESRLDYVDSYELLEGIKVNDWELSHEYHLVKWNGVLIKTSKLFGETSIAAQNPIDSSMNYFRQREHDENRDCGFRLPFTYEDKQIDDRAAFVKCKPLSRFKHDYRLTQENFDELKKELLGEVDKNCEE